LLKFGDKFSLPIILNKQKKNKQNEFIKNVEDKILNNNNSNNNIKMSQTQSFHNYIDT